MTINDRIEALRAVMKNKGLSAYIIPSSDAHLSEYTPRRWQSRTWISGFDGSAGTVVVTLDKAGLWTDSRYFLQASKQLSGTVIDLFKQGIPDTSSIETFLCNTLSEGDCVGVDGNSISYEEVKCLKDTLYSNGINLSLDDDLINQIWTDRPDIPNGKIFLHSEEFSGESAKDRITKVLDSLKLKGANTCIVAMLDELAWLFNIRGYDVAYNPVAVGFAVVSSKETVLFTLKEKITDEVRNYLQCNGVLIQDYEEIYNYISSMSDEARILVDYKRITEKLYKNIPSCCKKINGVSVITELKATKNTVELQKLRDVMVRDGVALTRFFKFLEESLSKGYVFTEYELGEKLNAFRAEGKNFYGDSFSTICGYNDHGAIVHYRATKEGSHKVQNNGVLLLDSGGQYFDGTTDVTRTIALSEPSERLKKDYTLVMKGHIAISKAIYMEGTRGVQIDILARKALWENGLNYGHGTGHGVGYFLNVHEGPQNIRTEMNPSELKVGMITSNEPGLYRTGEYGIRIENLVVTQEKQKTEFGRFLKFETLTLCFYDNNLIDKSLLTAEEIKWYNDYQENVYQSLFKYLNEEEAEWLRNKTKKI